MSGAIDPALCTGAPIVRLAPAKLNLTLAVLGRRPDGFHDLHSVVVALELADGLSLAAAAGGEDTLHVEGLPAGPPKRNLVLQAIAATRAELRRRSPYGPGGDDGLGALAARLVKRIPVAAGLGGGSSDASAAVDGALAAWGRELDRDDRLRLAAALGSDVPLFAVAGGGPVLVEGRGERVTPLRGIVAAADPPGILLVVPAVAVATSDVYSAFDAGLRPPPGARARAASEHLAGELGRGLDGGSFLARAGVLASANDLLPATSALVPSLVTARRGLARLLGRPIGQSGSGPTCWVLYPSPGAADAAAGAVRAALDDGRLRMPGTDRPAVIATAIARGSSGRSGATSGKEARTG